MTRRRFLLNAVYGAGTLSVARGYFNSTRYELQLTKYTVAIAGLPPLFRGLKIALLSDLHASLITSKKLISAAAVVAMQEKPDIIALTGDFITTTNKVDGHPQGTFTPDTKYVTECVDALSGISAPMGVYGVLGNHDFWSGTQLLNFMCTLFKERLNVVWLRNSHVKLERGGEHIYILGVDDYWEKTCSLYDAYKGVPDTAVKILLSHNPDINYEINMSGKININLILSGHTHGGQVVLPIVGAPFIPSPYGQKYRTGLVNDGSRMTCITNGVGISILPLRYNCPPEVVIISIV
ncbi:metallophosphoesterase [Candidatus Magnetominusculus xianensis]|uniref:Metallophosphoesterase n=1 Tax=Candidatus Magnetominusculus xianensis TaxID=1748249 RepID=A0ABR5SJ68_9BACT|nr:metallophosphoesterase [Candidatus Magnetominusculus xianensis]KWT93563.1 putative metallophosphoesterase [Candidatus Magnetominusculus xianensis]